MAYREKLRIYSLKHPDKTWSSADDFFADHAAEDAGVDIKLDELEDAGKLTVTETISEDGRYVTFTKDFDTKETYIAYAKANMDIIGHNETHYRFVEVYKGPDYLD